jgi:hypothetical protein
LFGTRYQVGPDYARRRVEVRYDPEALDEVEVHCKGRFVQRVRPFEVQPHRRPPPQPQSSAPQQEPGADWLHHLVEQRRREAFIEPSPQQLQNAARQQRRDADDAVINLLVDSLDPAVINIATMQAFLDRYGPFDPDEARGVLERFFIDTPRDLHVEVYLDAMHKQLKLKGEPS